MSRYRCPTYSNEEPWNPVAIVTVDGGRRNKIDQQQRDCAYCKRGCSRCFEDLPATESQHSHFPEPQSAVMKANSLCHRGVRATNGHLITPPSSVMKSRRFTPMSPVLPNERNSTQGTAALRDFDPVYVADGSF